MNCNLLNILINIVKIIEKSFEIFADFQYFLLLTISPKPVNGDLYGNHLGFLWFCDKNDKNVYPGLFVPSQLHLWQLTRQIALFLSTHNLFFVSHNLSRIIKFDKKRFMCKFKFELLYSRPLVACDS